MIALSILIPTVIGREDSYYKLVNKLNILTQGHPVEILQCKDNKEITIGEKRNMLYNAASGIYSWQIDDDDDVSGNSILQILFAINDGSDCVTFRERVNIDGSLSTSNHSIKYERWQDNFDGFDYVRCPYFKDVIKTEIAKSVEAPKIRWNEDEQWSYAIKPYLLTETHIDEEIYLYQCFSTEFNERYGIR